MSYEMIALWITAIVAFDVVLANSVGKLIGFGVSDDSDVKHGLKLQRVTIRNR